MAAVLAPGRPARAPRHEPVSRLVAALAACVVVAVVLRAPYVATPLGVDEGGVAAIARQWSGGHAWLYGGAWLDRPPLLVLLYKLAGLGGPVGIRALGAAAAAAVVVAVALLARLTGGPRAVVPAAAVAAVLTGSVALAAVYAPAELLAAAPSAASVLCLLVAHRHASVRWLVLAGALAVSAALIKQSFLDAGLAGAVYLVATSVVARRPQWRAFAAYAGGAALPLVPVVAWQVLAPPLHGGGLAYALVGFRLAGLHTLERSSLPLVDRVQALERPALRSGLVLALAATTLGLARLRREPVVCAVLCAWLAGGLVGVAGGGSYWPHYLIEVVPVVSVAVGVLLAATPAVVRRVVSTAVLGAGLVAAAAGAAAVHAHPPHAGAAAAGRYLRTHARPGDTQYVLYAHANVGYYSDLPSPYPYAWSLMVRSIPSAPARLRALLRSGRRPTWVVVWEHPGAWRLDRHHRTARMLRREYVRVAAVAGRPILLRRDVAHERRVVPAGRARARARRVSRSHVRNGRAPAARRGQASRPSRRPWR